MRFSLSTRVHLRANFSRNIITINEIRIFRIIGEWYLLFFAKFRSHHVKIAKSYDGKFILAKCSRINYGATLSIRKTNCYLIHFDQSP